MALIPKMVVERYRKAVPQFQRILKTAKDRDLNEADTVSIIKGILSEVFGFDKYLEITSEYAIRGTYCDLAIKMDDNIQYLIEVKAIGISLSEKHLRQALGYAANKGVKWIVLTNGIEWNLYKVRFERPIKYDLVTSFNFLELNHRKTDTRDTLFLLSRKGIIKAVRDEYFERIQSVNRFTIAALVVSEPIVKALRREMKKMSSGLNIEVEEIEKILHHEVLKRDVIEGEDAAKASSRVRKLFKQAKRQSKSETDKSKITRPATGSIRDIHSEEESTGS